MMHVNIGFRHMLRNMTNCKQNAERGNFIHHGFRVSGCFSQWDFGFYLKNIYFIMLLRISKN